MKGALYMKRAENFERKLEYSKSPYLVKKQDRPIDWVVTVPGSKSMTNRALLMAALSDGTAEISGVLFSDDSRHFLECLLSLGVEVDIREKERKVRIAGHAWANSGKGSGDKRRQCRNSRAFSDCDVGFFGWNLHDRSFGTNEKTSHEAAVGFAGTGRGADLLSGKRRFSADKHSRMCM